MKKCPDKYVLMYHTIYKNLSVLRFWAVCGCVRVCDTSLEPSWHPHKRMPGALAPACAARPQLAKMCFLLHKAALNGRFEKKIEKKSCRMNQTNEYLSIGGRKFTHENNPASHAPAVRKNVFHTPHKRPKGSRAPRGYREVSEYDFTLLGKDRQTVKIII